MKTAKAAIQEYIEAAVPGDVIYYRDVADKYGYTYPSMSVALADVAREENSPLRPGPKAGYYVVAERRAKHPENSFMEVLGTMQDGSVMLRDHDMKLWKAVQL